MINVVRKPEDTVVENNSEACQEAQSEKDPKDCGRRSAERKRQWNFPQQSRGVPRRGEPAVRQPSPSRAGNNQRRQRLHLSSSAFLPQTLGLYRQARGFCEGLSIVAPITLKVKLSCAIIITGVYGDHALSTCREIKRAN